MREKKGKVFHSPHENDRQRSKDRESWRCAVSWSRLFFLNEHTELVHMKKTQKNKTPWCSMSVCSDRMKLFSQEEFTSSNCQSLTVWQSSSLHLVFTLKLNNYTIICRASASCYSINTKAPKSAALFQFCSIAQSRIAHPIYRWSYFLLALQFPVKIFIIFQCRRLDWKRKWGQWHFLYVSLDPPIWRPSWVSPT